MGAPVVGACVGALVGALVWGLITKFTGYEVSWVAWGVGLAVGFGAATLGGRGPVMGVVCGALAVVAIFGGKVLANHWWMDSFLEDYRNEALTQEVYDDYAAEATAYAATATETDRKGFLIEHGYSEECSVPDVSDEELVWFENELGADMRKFAAAPPTLAQWQSRQVARERVSWGSPVQQAVFELGLFDIIWVVLGVSTAVKVGGQAQEAPQRPSRQPLPTGPSAPTTPNAPPARQWGRD
jgi:hypothetical protein